MKKYFIGIDWIISQTVDKSIILSGCKIEQLENNFICCSNILKKEI